jgi:hypothetical protein
MKCYLIYFEQINEEPKRKKHFGAEFSVGWKMHLNA